MSRDKVKERMKDIRNYLTNGQIKLHKPPFAKIWYFETTDIWIYNRFVQVLGMFDVAPLEEYAVPYDEYSSCKFCCIEKYRLLIEYVFRRLINLESRYLLDLESYQNRCHFYMEERYAIY